MNNSMRPLVFVLMFILLLSACSEASNPSDDTSSQANNTGSCPSLVQDAVEAADQNCQGIGRNQVCYGNVSLQAETANDAVLSDPGDITDLENILSLDLSPMDVSQQIWGVVMMKLQANIADTMPGQAVTFLMFGDVELENQYLNEDGIQSFYFKSGIGDAQCNESPDSGILVQTPEGVANITLSVNNVEIALGSTAYLQAEPDAEMAVNVLEGQAVVTAQGMAQTVSAGNQTRIELDGNGFAVSEPSVPEPYDSTHIEALPIESLDQKIVVASTIYSANFVDNPEEWAIFQDGTDIEHLSADDTSDGSICSTDLGSGVYWFFNAPASWLGDRSDLYNGYLNYTIRQRDNAGYDSGPDILLVSEELTLQYEFDIKPYLTWTGYSVLLNENAGWTTDGTTPPTSDEFTTMLENLSAVRIRGEYVSGADSACLDSVQFVRGGHAISDTGELAAGLLGGRVTNLPDGIQGWRIFQDGSQLEYFSADDESDGYICAVDLGGGVYWYFEIPQRMITNRTDLYNGLLQYRLRQRDFAGTVRGIPDVILVSDAMTLLYEFEEKPLLTWTPFSLTLNESQGWTLEDGTTPTAEDFQAVLKNLRAVRIRGEYVSGSDSACIDNLQLLGGA